LFPLLVVVVAISLEYSGLDRVFVSQFYDVQHQQWIFKRHWFLEDVMHVGGKNLAVGMAVMILLAWLASFVHAPLHPFRRQLLFLLLASLSGPAIVSLLKTVTHISTPWGLDIFGGSKPYIRVFDAVPEDMPPGRAFPGGHSSGGFAFFSFYFLALYCYPRYRWQAILVPLLVGGSFALTQWLRGAHFPSHDLFSLVICWCAAWFWAQLLLGRCCYGK
jgi:membrane-associated PAP2 superfamily phosphatase